MTARELLNTQREYFESGKTLPLAARINALNGLERAIRAHEGEVLGALRKDLSKSNFEGYMTELGMVYAEIGYMRKNLKKLMRPVRAKTPVYLFPAKSYSVPSPYGTALIVGPWNYPFQLTILPLVDCLAAGNTALVKASASAPASAAVIRKIIGEAFRPEYVSFLPGGREENKDLFDQKYDVLFFTGGKETGRRAAAAAAKNLAHAVLELGGKSPCIVRADANIPLAARRIAFGKFLNAGQTCVAPDYVLAHPKIRARLIAAIEEETVAMYGEDPLSNPDYPKMINRRQFDRVLSLIDGEKTVFGGRSDPSSLKIAPTVTENVSFSDPVMKEEIFGPVLPVLEAESFEEIKAAIAHNPTPLALYWFGNREEARRALSEISFGGGCIGDTVMHLATHELGFGGVGESGTGAYHGARGFFAFSHVKSILDAGSKFDLPFRYAPATPKKEKVIRKYMK